MRYELSFIRRYLTPSKKQLSSLIALLSFVVISLVIWLILVFLSITEGIERQWMERLTALHGPLKILPTEEYYASYYYQIDRHAHLSQFGYKSIKEKAASLRSDPYDPESDAELPAGLLPPDLDAQGHLKDPVKAVLSILKKMQSVHPLAFQDFELSGALMKLNLFRPFDQDGRVSNTLTQVSYLSSFPDQNPLISKLLAPIRPLDIQEILGHALYARQPLEPILSHVAIKTVQPSSSFWQLPRDAFEEGATFVAEPFFHQSAITHFVVPAELPLKRKASLGLLSKDPSGAGYYFQLQGEKNGVQLSGRTPVFIEGRPLFKVINLIHSVEKNPPLLALDLIGTLQNRKIALKLPFQSIKVVEAEGALSSTSTQGSSPPWVHRIGTTLQLPIDSVKGSGVLLPRQFQDLGARIGDTGYFSYPSLTATSTQEQRLPIFVAGFYDPGIMAVGNRCILANNRIPQIINHSHSQFSLEGGESNGIMLWFSDFEKADTIKLDIERSLSEAGIDRYWRVVSFKDYPSVKELIQQFQGDTHLFTLIGAIVLIVACSNIISHLLLLVGDKKKEIAILGVLGASRKSILSIFALSGVAIALLSCCFGLILAYLTMKNISALLHLLSLAQGIPSFSALLNGSAFSHSLSMRAVGIVLVLTPLLSLIAGLIPALKAGRLNISKTLRSE